MGGLTFGGDGGGQLKFGGGGGSAGLGEFSRWGKRG